MQRLERTLQRRVLRLFQRRGLLDDHTVADMRTWQGAGGFSLDPGGPGATHVAWGTGASVRIHGSDSAGRERLLRSCARPPLERLRIQRHTATAGHDSRQKETAVRQVLYTPPRPTLDGRTVLARSPLEFLAALSRPEEQRLRSQEIQNPSFQVSSPVAVRWCSTCPAWAGLRAWSCALLEQRF